MWLRSLLVCGMCVGFAAASASGEDFARAGVYGAIQWSAGIPLSDLSRDDTGFGGGARVGYRVAPRFAAEFQAEYSGDSGFDDTHQTLLTLNGKLYALDQRIQPYGVLGLGVSLASSNSRNVGSSFAFRAGGGVDAYLTEHVAVFVEATYARPTRSASALDLVSVGFGLLYRW